MAPTLCVLDGPPKHTGIRLTAPVTVGRDESCDLTLPDSAVSRQHARIEPVGGRVLVVDLDSLNGTFVDGRPVARTLLETGTVRIGDTLLRIGRFSEHWSAADSEGPLVGGTALAPVRRAISLAGPTDLPVLITGETGTGKEVAARMVHEASGRAGPFIAVNCAALPATLLESELFGHARGAFTGATQAREGLFRTASGGTLFLDEVGDMPLEAQTKLLRVLEDGIVRPVGAERGQRVDVRVVSATNRDLSARVAAGAFRADLLGRLAGVEIHIPPLRERLEDLPALATYLLERAGLRGIELEPDALEALLLHDWPMNARELESALRTATLGDTGAMQLEALPEPIRDAFAQRRHGKTGDVLVPTAATSELRSTEDLRERVLRALRAHQGNVRRATQAVGLSRAHVYRLLRQWDVDPNQFRGKGARTRSTFPPSPADPDDAATVPGTGDAT